MDGYSDFVLWIVTVFLVASHCFYSLSSFQSTVVAQSLLFHLAGLMVSMLKEIPAKRALSFLVIYYYSVLLVSVGLLVEHLGQPPSVITLVGLPALLFTLPQI